MGRRVKKGIIKTKVEEEDKLSRYVYYIPNKYLQASSLLYINGSGILQLPLWWLNALFFCWVTVTLSTKEQSRI